MIVRAHDNIIKKEEKKNNQNTIFSITAWCFALMYGQGFSKIQRNNRIAEPTITKQNEKKVNDRKNNCCALNDEELFKKRTTSIDHRTSFKVVFQVIDEQERSEDKKKKYKRNDRDS